MKTTFNGYFKLIIDFIIVIITILKHKLKNISYPIKIKFDNKKNKKCIILGNGPSLNDDIDSILKVSNKDLDIYSVNYFARSKFFKVLKPNYYFFSDKMFWRKDLLLNVKKDNELIFEILKSVDWKITIICPNEGLHNLKNKLSVNKNLSFVVVPIRFSNLLTPKFTYLSIRYRFFSVPNVNSVITLLWTAVFMNYKKILLYGCDFSAFKSFMVDQKTNEMTVSTKHFYSNSSAEKNASKKYVGQRDKTLSERIFQVYRGFRYLDVLSKISKDLNVNVINCSSFSFIDSFPRIQDKDDSLN